VSELRSGRFGTTKQLVLCEDGWDGEHTLRMTGEGARSVDVTIKITLK
jgi:hypothetical protein